MTPDFDALRTLQYTINLYSKYAGDSFSDGEILTISFQCLERDQGQRLVEIEGLFSRQALHENDFDLPSFPAPSGEVRFGESRLWTSPPPA